MLLWSLTAQVGTLMLFNHWPDVTAAKVSKKELHIFDVGCSELAGEQQTFCV